MTFRLRQLGDPILTQVAEPVTEFKTPALQDLIEGMLATLKEAQGGGAWLLLRWDPCSKC